MTSLVWPTDLPRPERNTWQSQPQDARRKRQSETGTPSWGRRFSSAATLVSLSVLLDRNQRAVFDNFYRFDTKGGVSHFWMPDPTTDGWPLLMSDGRPLLTSAGVPILLSARWLCSFGETVPAETVVGIQFRKNFSIAVLP
jgi:hypothetical protein